jgi:hypothetical protein
MGCDAKQAAWVCSTHHIDTTVARNSDNAVERTQVNADNRHGLSVKAGYLGGKGRERKGARRRRGGKTVKWWKMDSSAAERAARYAGRTGRAVEAVRITEKMLR